MIYYAIVFIAAFLVDIIPVFGPPAWSVMVFMQIKFDLQIWYVIVIGVAGSTLGRYVLSRFIIPHLSDKYVDAKKNDELEYLGNMLNKRSWKSSLFVLIYTLLPIPSAPLFTAAGIARIKPYAIIPPFFVGKFTSDAFIVLAGKYASDNIEVIMKGLFVWQTALSFVIGIILLSLVLIIDWKTLLIRKKLRFNYKVWKSKTDLS